MIAVLKPGTTDKQIDNFTEWLKGRGLSVHISKGDFHTIIGLVGDVSRIDIGLLESLEMVESVKRISEQVTDFAGCNRLFEANGIITASTKIDSGL